MSDRPIELDYATPGTVKAESYFWTLAGVVLPNVLGALCGSVLTFLLVSNTILKYDLMFVTAMAAALFGVVGILGAIERSKLLIYWNSALFVLSVVGLNIAGRM